MPLFESAGVVRWPFIWKKCVCIGVDELATLNSLLVKRRIWFKGLR